MAPIDWDKLMKLDVQELQDDAVAADDMYCVLCDVRNIHPAIKSMMAFGCYYAVNIL